MDESSDTEKSNIMNHTLTQGYRMSFVPECCEFTNIDVIDLNCDPERQLRSQSQYQYQYQGISCIDDRERHIAAMTAYLRDVQQFQRGLLDRDTWGMGVNMRNYIYSSNRRYRDMIKPNRLKGTTGIRNDQTLYSSEVSQMKAISKEVKDLEIRTKNLHTMIGSKNKYEVSLVETLEEFKILTENVNTLFKQLPPSDCNIHKRKLLKEMKKLKFLIQNVCNQYNYGEQHVNEYLEEMNGLISIPREKHHNLTNFDDTNQAIPTSSTKHKMEKNYRGQLIDTMLYNNFMEMQEEDEGNQEHLELITEKMEPCPTLSTHHVINITEQEDQELQDKSNTFLELCSRAIYCPPELRSTLVATLYAVQLGQLWALGNPFDTLSRSSKDTLSLEQAFSMFLPAII